MSAAFWFMVAVASTALFTFLSFIIWFDGRQTEREAHYRDEMARKIANADDPAALLEYVRANERADAEKSRISARVGGLITFAVGLGLMIFLHQVAQGSAAYLIGLIPGLIGVVLLIHSELMMRPKA